MSREPREAPREPVPSIFKVAPKLPEKLQEKLAETMNVVVPSFVVTKDNYNKDITLHSKWNIYDHIKCDKADYDKNTNLIGSCSTVFEFWNCYSKIPKPSQIFYSKENGKPYYMYNGTKREISAISVFRDGIFPKWEDPVNAKGSSFEYRLSPDTNIDQMDTMWLYISMYAMGLHFTEQLTGYRIVDSSIMAQAKPLYKIELWFDNDAIVPQMEQKFRSLFKIDPGYKIITRKHNA
jgi:hypothetical protein